MAGDRIANSERPHRASDVLDLLFAHVLEGEVSPVADLVAHYPADADPPPGSAKASRRAVMFTPSPKMSSPSAITSPRLIPTRNSIRFSVGTDVFRSAIPRCTCAAQRTASTTLANSA